MRIVSVESIKRKGLEKVTVDGLVEEITPKGRGRQPLGVIIREEHSCFTLPESVPDSVKAELLQRIRTFLQNN